MSDDFPAFALSEEQEALREAVRALADDKIAPRAAEIDRTSEFPWDVYEALVKADFHALHIPEEYGGAGGDALVTPMQGTIVKIVAGEGAVVKAGDTVVILEAMKMEQPLAAHKDGTVTNLAVEVGQTVSADTEICQIKE